jgi:CHAT domain-containing protein
MIGLGIEQLDRPKQALKFLDEAISTQERHPDIARPSVAYGAKIDSLAELGQYNEALRLADQALEFPRKHRFYGQLQSLLTSRADVLVRTGRTADAITEYLEGLDYAKTIRSWRGITNIDAKLASAYERMGILPKALSAIDEAIWANQQISQEMFFVPGNLAIKARIQAKLGRRADAEHLYLKGADMLDVMLTHVPTPEIERLLLTELGDLYSGFFELLSNDGRYADAFRVIEQAHGRIEAQELEYNHTEEPHGPTPDDDQLRALELDLLNTDDVRTRAEILHKIHTFQQINWVGRTDEKTATLAEVQRQLAPYELLVEYVLARPQSYALVIGRSSVARYSLPTKEAVEKEAGKYADDLRKQRTNLQLGRQLFQELLGFTRDYPNATSLIVVADGGLHLLPFNALIDDSGKYVLESKSVSVTPSGTVLCLLRHRVQAAAATRPYLGVAAWTDAGDTRPWVLRAIPVGSKPSQWPPLPESRDEVESIAAMMPMPPPPKVLVGQNATKEQFQRLPLGDYRVLHLALHGVADPVFPDRSAIVFAPSKGDDGRLEARDIRRMHIHAALVTLSACDTGVGPVGAAGVESVDTAFIEAGASSVVSTLWKLEDHATNRLMKTFYANLGHEAKADALRHAELDLLHSGLTPFYWASYELVGGPKGALFTSNVTD